MTTDSKHEWWLQVAAEIGKETDLNNFKNWPIVRNIPLYRDNEFHEEYGNDIIDMLNTSKYKDEWINVLKLNEPKLGHTEASWQAAQTMLDVIPTTGVVLKNTHHLMTFEELRGKTIHDYDTIVELGAGIGEMARLIFDRGFKGKYYVVDFPEVTLISSFYNANKIIAVDHISKLPDDLDTSKTLFIATWSLSETPFEYRDEVGAKLAGCDSLILSQSAFKELETNIPYFLNVWPKVNHCFYRLRQLEFHTGDGGNMYIICKGGDE